MDQLTLILLGLRELLALAEGISAKAEAENRDPTPEEMQQIHDARKAAEDRWTAGLAK